LLSFLAKHDDTCQTVGIQEAESRAGSGISVQIQGQFALFSVLILSLYVSQNKAVMLIVTLEYCEVFHLF
jgi:hypothetical protein